MLKVKTESLVLFIGVLFIGTLALIMSSSVNAKSEKQVGVTPVQNLKYYGEFPQGVSSFETSDNTKCFVVIGDIKTTHSYGTAISCFKK